MDGQEKLDYETIKAAVAGEKGHRKVALAHSCGLHRRAFHGGDWAAGRQSEKADEDKAAHFLKLLEALPSFPLEQE